MHASEAILHGQRAGHHDRLRSRAAPLTTKEQSVHGDDRDMGTIDMQTNRDSAWLERSAWSAGWRIERCALSRTRRRAISGETQWKSAILEHQAAALGLVFAVDGPELSPDLFRRAAVDQASWRKPFVRTQGRRFEAIPLPGLRARRHGQAGIVLSRGADP